MRYYIIAGEASGDLHGSNLMKGIYSEDSKAEIRFRGGQMMESVYSGHEAEGCGKAYDYREGAIMGLMEVLAKAGSLLKNMSDCKKDIICFNPDVIILVDYPGFNLRIAEWAHRKGIKVFYYIAPKVWASREGRIKNLKRDVDHTFIVFPFEREYFALKGLPCTYCGNPLVDAVADSAAMSQSHDDFCRENGLEPGTRYFAMLAGSRLNEVSTMMPLLKETASILHSKPEFSDYKFIIAGAPGRSEAEYGEYDKSYIKVIFGQTQSIVHSAEAAAINSGTASLEAVLLGTPQVVAYRIKSRITYFIAKYFLLKSKYISLGNLCLNRLAFKEFYRIEDCTAENVAAELERLVSDKEYRATMLDDYAAIRSSLGGSGASRAVAKAMINLLKK